MSMINYSGHLTAFLVTFLMRNTLTILMIMVVLMVIIVVNCTSRYQTQPSHSGKGPSRSVRITPALWKHWNWHPIRPPTSTTMVAIQVAMRRESRRVRMFLLMMRTVEKKLRMLLAMKMPATQLTRAPRVLACTAIQPYKLMSFLRELGNFVISKFPAHMQTPTGLEIFK